MNYLFLNDSVFNLGPFKHFMLHRHLVESFSYYFFVFIAAFFSLSRVLFARCVTSLLCAASCGLFYFIKAFLGMHWTDFCASYYLLARFPQPNAAIAKFLSSFILSSSFLLYSQLLKCLLKGSPGSCF